MTFITGKQKITEADLREPDYSFDIIGAWRDDRGFYLGTDSGCSCPSPWESHTAEDLTGPLTLDQAVEESVSLWTNAGKYDEAGFKDYLNALTQSFLTTLDTRYIAHDYDWDTVGKALGVIDVNGVEWSRLSVGVDFESAAGVIVDEYSLSYPVEIVETTR